MGRSVILGLDIGTTNVKAAAYLENGERLAAASIPYPTYYPQPGWAEQNPLDWRGSIKDALTQLAQSLRGRVEEIAALGLSAHAPGLIPVDSRGSSLLERVPIWMDERSLEQGKALLAEIGPEWVGLGMPFASFAAKLRWFTEARPDLAEEAAYALGVKAYLVHWLTSRYATDPSSEPGRSGIWEQVCGACGWSPDRLAPVLPAGEIVGEARAELASELGLRVPVPVILGLNDGASATLGCGALKPGEGAITLATNAVFFLVAGRAVPAQSRLDRAVFCWPYLGETYIAGGQTKTGAASLRWFLSLLSGENEAKPDFDEVLRECAGRPPGSRGVTFLPYLLGRGTPKDDPSATGGFLGLTLRTDRADLTRAVLEGVAFTLREIQEELGRLDLEAGDLAITGGGAESGLWRQIVADVLNRPLRYSSGDSCLGAAILAASGAGLFPSIGATAEAMRGDTLPVLPQPEAAAVYDRLFGEFCRTRDLLLGQDPEGS